MARCLVAPHTTLETQLVVCRGIQRGLYVASRVQLVFESKPHVLAPPETHISASPDGRHVTHTFSYCKVPSGRFPHLYKSIALSLRCSGAYDELSARSLVRPGRLQSCRRFASFAPPFYHPARYFDHLAPANTSRRPAYIIAKSRSPRGLPVHGATLPSNGVPYPSASASLSLVSFSSTACRSASGGGIKRNMHRTVAEMATKKAMVIDRRSAPGYVRLDRGRSRSCPPSR